jgi:hypothetical protein
MPDPLREAGIPNPLTAQRGVDDLREYIASVLSKALPKGLRCRVQVTIDGRDIIASNVRIEFAGAPPMAKTGGPGSGNGRFGR